MKQTVKISGVDVELNATAYTPIKYKMLFKQDLLKQMSLIDDDNVDEIAIMQLCYTMADTELSLEEFLNQFDLKDFYDAMPSILKCWAGSQKTTSKPKNVRSK